MLLLTQYYRPPFPAGRRWREDLRQIADAGLDAVEIWATWSWIEAEPGVYRFDDFDRLFDEAATVDLDVVVTAVAELNPYWIHRIIPDSHMVDHRGRRIESESLSYTHHGVCPGGCTDHPEVRKRVGAFLAELGAHFAARPNLRNWDCWNELRWSVQSDGHVCFCDHTVAAFRAWLEERYGDLDGLNEAWQRRYSDWSDVHPGKQPARHWTETIAFEQFLSWRAAELATFRADGIRAGDPSRPVIAHSVVLSSFMTKSEGAWEQPLSRGNDWEIAERVDGFGASHFPNWFQTTNAEYGVRLESARSAAAGKPYWVCELQGGAAGNGFVAMPEVTAAQQQRWVWTAYGRGAEAIAFWCWRDEVFGRESGGFGIAGNDGHAAERIAALTATTRCLREHEDLLDGYVPDQPLVAVLFDGVNHQLEWAATGLESELSGGSILGAMLALERTQIPYDVLEAAHLPDLDRYKLIFLPLPLIVRSESAARLENWVRGGGTLVVESELDCFDEHGLFRYPDERPFPRALGLTPSGRRTLGDVSTIEFQVGTDRGSLRTATWLEEFDREHFTVKAVGNGRVVAVGTHAALAYRRERYDDFERFVRALATEASAAPDVTCSVRDGELVQWRTGLSGNRRLLFVSNGGPATDVTFRSRTLFGSSQSAVELRSGDTPAFAADAAGGASLTLRLTPNDAQVLAF
jgi:beta-galactosidase